jgi:hypothetical protein
MLVGRIANPSYYLPQAFPEKFRMLSLRELW